MYVNIIISKKYQRFALKYILNNIKRGFFLTSY